MSADYKNRIIGQEMVDVSQIVFNPMNWRVHPRIQQESLNDVLEEIGWVQSVVVNQRTGNLVDGHLRVQLASNAGIKTVPATIVDLSEAEEQAIIATLDPLGAMAKTDKDKLSELISMNENEALAELLQQIAQDNNLISFANDDDGLALDLIDITVSPPKTLVAHGDIFSVGEHRLVCCSPVHELELYREFIHYCDMLVPYASTTTLLSELAQERKILCVMPSEYLCGHLLDQYKAVYGETSVTKEN